MSQKEGNLASPLISTDQDQKRADQIRGRLFVLQTALEDLKTEVDRSYNLHEIGEKTEIVEQIEKILDNPLNSIFEMSEEFDKFINSVIESLAKGFLISKKELIKSIYSEKTDSNDLFYAIVLNENSFENRSSLLRFFDFFYTLDISKKYPVSFQFVPTELENKFSKFKQVTLDA
jgi:hypothetical protein